MAWLQPACILAQQIISFQNKKSKLILARKHQTTDGKLETSWKACTKHIYKTANNQFGKLDKVFKTNMRHITSLAKYVQEKEVSSKLKKSHVSLLRPILTNANTDTLICLQYAPFFLALVVWRKKQLTFLWKQISFAKTYFYERWNIVWGGPSVNKAKW